MTRHWDAERIVDRLDPGVEVAVDLDYAQAMVEGGRYELSFGMFTGAHYRKQCGDGCYHLRIVGDEAWLHRDAWDPRRFPVQHTPEIPALGKGAKYMIGGLLLAAAGIAVSLL